jgi:hypothetical protein
MCTVSCSLLLTRQLRLLLLVLHRLDDLQSLQNPIQACSPLSPPYNAPGTPQRRARHDGLSLKATLSLYLRVGFRVVASPTLTKRPSGCSSPALRSTQRSGSTTGRPPPGSPCVAAQGDTTSCTRCPPLSATTPPPAYDGTRSPERAVSSMDSTSASTGSFVSSPTELSPSPRQVCVGGTRGVFEAWGR